MPVSSSRSVGAEGDSFTVDLDPAGNGSETLEPASDVVTAAGGSAGRGVRQRFAERLPSGVGEGQIVADTPLVRLENVAPFPQASDDDRDDGADPEVVTIGADWPIAPDTGVPTF
ncbi:hypothetical protein ACFFX0_31080 [Citricoccus parietis]|uniref:Uncharacterized protein n=1 Tax=Citricoccus parietis TaxID=592307 RepID=A0ABV5G8Y7_9MICC